jgi:3-oxoacyl-[acyl-carrier-protein] synthase-1
MSSNTTSPFNIWVTEMIYISAVGMINALGNDTTEIAANLVRGISPGMRPRNGWLRDHDGAVLGGVDAPLPDIPETFAAHRSRNNQLLLAALAQIQPQVDDAIARFGRDRVAVVLGTSTSGLDEGDRHVDLTLNNQPSTHWHYPQQELGDPSRFLNNWLGLEGPAFTLSTACSSSARAIISGRRLIDAGLADVAIVGGADTLSRMPINGFDSLESLSPTLCQPFGRDRRGITIGEGAALMLLTREPQPIALLGVGESSDAWHISAPHPQGEGAIRAIRQALDEAQLAPADVGYINLHGTATALNDQIEANVLHALFGDGVPCSSTKHLTGHTLGAAGITEAAISMLILQESLPLPAQDFSTSPIDPTLPACGILHQPQPLARPIILSNSFAFGGNNASILLGRTV